MGGGEKQKNSFNNNNIICVNENKKNKIEN